MAAARRVYLMGLCCFGWRVVVLVAFVLECVLDFWFISLLLLLCVGRVARTLLGAGAEGILSAFKQKYPALAARIDLLKTEQQCSIS